MKGNPAHIIPNYMICPRGRDCAEGPSVELLPVRVVVRKEQTFSNYQDCSG